MSIDLTQQTNGSPATPSSLQRRLRHRKRSSSLCALDGLSLPSPPLSPSVSVNFSRDSAVTGEIPIIFDFLTTSSMSSEERLFKMASLKPELPPLAKFSPMSAFFPMSDSTGTLNTISAEILSSTRPPSLCSETSQQRCSTLSISSAAYTPLESIFGLASPTEVVNIEQPQSPEQLLPTSFTMPSVQVQDYDTGQKKLGDISNFTISAYLTSPSAMSLESFGPNGLMEELESSASPNSLLSAPTTPDEDDKTPTQSMFMRRSTPSHEQALPVVGGISLFVHPSPDYDDEAPTQEMFLRRQTTVERPNITASPVVTEDASPASRSSLSMPISPDFDDKTPTQSMFFKRQINLEPQPQPFAKRATCTIQPEVVSRRKEKPLPAEPVEDVEDEPSQTTGPNAPETEEPPSPSVSVPRNAPSVPCLRHAQWLRDTVVELWIDQEGFRAIRPKFFLASVSNGLPYTSDHSHGSSHAGTLELTEEHDPLYTTVAEFLPVSRAAHYFHHAAFDRAPTLHRITTGNDETKDYISRAASISLKDNGVFFVHGTEDHRIDATDRPLSFSGGINSSYQPYHHNNFNNGTSNGHGSGTTGRFIRLNWRFEYYVSNRRPDGRSAHRGEKVITPLSFSCTPALLDRNRANKVTVLHIMKKTLLPNLVAQKLEPPDLAPVPVCMRPSVTSLASLLSASESYGFVVSHNHHIANNSYKAATATSTIPKPITTTITANNTRMPKPFIPPLLDPPPRPPLPNTKHRRGSHSDTTPDDFIRQQQRSIHTNSISNRNRNHERSRSACAVSASLVPGTGGGSGLIGPIISQEELMRMLDGQSAQSVRAPEPENGDHGGDIRRPHSIRVEVVNNIRMTTLPAAPRYKHNP